MDVTFLGTGAGMPSKTRNTSSMILNLRNEGEDYWMFDCGEATQHQLLHTSIKPSKINRIFITHLHGDHIFGLPGFLSSRSFLGGDTPLTIYGPAGLEAWLTLTMQTTKTYIPYPIQYEIIEDGAVIDFPKFRVSIRKLAHVIDSYGYRVEEKERSGTLLIEEALKRGVPRGPLLSQLKNGQDIVLANGTLVKSEEVTTARQRGRVVTILGDTSYTKASVELAHEADLLIHEATFDDATSTIAKQYGHATIREAAQVAREAGVKHLLVTHISARFMKHDLPTFLAQGEAVFSPISIAEDFMTVDVPLYINNTTV
ncbi:ribonuclease Z [Savagea sp. SN6]|uniref:Ribonuclease Z n=1 Tax=Savagea serpentis TaxID=2785297 RepID=A0A8J7G9D1_9BACL|nr:ribonuclease Z [Savagea serpentis]MBF4500280.1 ribonuclease Z [Savagea serpentis]